MFTEGSSAPRAVCLVAVLIVLVTLPVSAQLDTHLDTLVTRPVGPGMTHYHIEAPNIPWSIHVLEVDLDNPYLQMRTVKAHDRLVGLERTSSMARRHDKEGYRVVGAINADYYQSGGIPSSIQIEGGEFVRNHIAGRQGVGWDDAFNMMIETVTFQGSVRHGGVTRAVNNINAARNDNQLILYNRFMGGGTGTNEFGTEVAVIPTGEWSANDTMYVVVQAVRVQAGNTSIPTGGAVLSGHGTAAAFLGEAQVNDTLALYMGTSPGMSGLKEMVSGLPLMVNEGQRITQPTPWAHSDTRHPRTGVGFNADTTRAYFVTVDGRAYHSYGMSLNEFGDLFVTIGAWRAVNLDGGGSTTMIVRDEMVNIGSDGSERSVANSIIIASTAPEGDLSRIEVRPTSIKLFQGQTTEVRVSGTDAWFNPRPIDSGLLSFAVDERVGYVSPEGVFTAGLQNDTGFVYIDYGDLRDSIRVIVTTVDSLSVWPKSAMTDTIRTVRFRPTLFDQDRVIRQVPAQDLQWSTSDPEVGVVDGEGFFTGRQPGSTWLTVAYNDIRDSAYVEVRVVEGGEILASFDDVDGWSIGGVNMNLDATRVDVDETRASEGDASMVLHYSFVHDRNVRNDVRLIKNIPLHGVPDSIFIDAWTNGERHIINFDFIDAHGNLFRAARSGFADSADGFRTMGGSISNATPVGDHSVMHFPISFYRLEIRLWRSGVHDDVISDSLWLDNLRVSYPQVPTSAIDEPQAGEGFALFPNYPNPFSGTTTISYRLDQPGYVTLVVFDLLGREVRRLQDGVQAAGVHQAEFDGKALPSGLYFYRLEATGRAHSRSLTIIH
jgi:exopolysaccharide biosynthesis protein